MTDQEMLADILYRAFMACVIDAKEVEAVCKRFGIAYPPKQFMGYQRTQ
jgi:hypothetical protein